MRKNIFNTVAGLLVAVSMLFAAIGCTNINDPDTLKNDSFTVNKMAITGFKVTGLNNSYDHNAVELVAVKGDKETVIASGIIADDAVDGAPGTAFVKLATPYIFDAGENSPVDFECYLKVVEAGVKILATSSEDATVGANAKLPIIPSPYGTKDADLVKRYVNVTVLNGTGDFEFVETAEDSIRFSYTSLGSHDWAEISTADWATVTSVAKTDATYAKYKITINNLEKDEDGMRYILAGSTIGTLDKSKVGDFWYGNAKDDEAGKVDAFISTVEDHSITFEFYAGGASFNPSAGCAIKISAVDDPMKSDPWLCLLTGPKGDNLFLPIDKDYTVVIDAKKANADYVASEIGDRCFNIAGVKVISDKLTGDDDVYFLSNWLPGNAWDATSPNKVLAKDVDGSATFEFTSPIKVWAGEADTIRTIDPVQVIQFTDKTNFWADGNKIVTEAVKIRAELAEYIGKTFTLVLDMTDEANPDIYLDVCPVTIKAVRVINADVKDDTKIYFLDGDLLGTPDDKWNESNTDTALVANKKATFTLSSPKVMDMEKFTCQIVYIKEGESTFGDGWANVIKLSTGDVKVNNLFDNGTYVLEFDAVANTFALKAE